MKVKAKSYVVYTVLLNKEEQEKFLTIPYGCSAVTNKTEIPLLSDIAWSRSRNWESPEEPFLLNEEEYNALVEYLNK